jgi:hypothetical protein
MMRRSLTCLLLGVLVLASACEKGSDTPGPEPAPDVPSFDGTTLEQGRSRQELSGAAGSELSFAMPVPAGQARLTFTLSNAANADLYVRFGAQPTTTRYDCRSQTTATVEECRIDAPVEGLWFVTVRGTAAYTGASLTGYVTPFPEPALVALTSGQPVPGLSVPAGEMRYFSLNVPTGQARVAFELTGGTGEAVLVAGYGDKPWPGTAECTSELRGTSASCVLNAPRAGTWFVALQGRTALSGFTLEGTHTAVGDGAPVVLTLGEWTPGLSGSPLQDALFRIDVPENQLQLAVELAGGTGTADFTLARERKPNPSDFDCAGTATTPCLRSAPGSGAWFVRLRGVSAYSDLRLRATLTAPVPLTLGVPKTGLSGLRGETLYFRFEVPPGTPGLRWTTPYDSRLRLSLRQGGLYAGATATCSSESSCLISHPQAGAWFGFLSFSENVSDVRVLAMPEQGPVSSLEDNVPLDIAAPAGAFRYYTFKVPEGVGQLRFDLFNPAPASFYVQRGREPTLSDFLCRGIGSRENPHLGCTFQNPQAGTWYALVESTEALEGVVRATTSPLPQAVQGMQERLSSGAQNSERLWRIEVPEGRSDLLVRLTEGPVTGAATGSGDTALLVKRGGIPNSADHDCKSDNPGSVMETCAFTNPLPGTWYILVRGKLAYTGVYLEATHAGTPGEGVEALENGVARLDLKDRGSAYRLWKLDVPEGQRRLEFDLSGGAGDVDLSVQYGTRPTATGFQCRAVASAFGERCVIDNPRAGTWFVLARSTSDFRGMFLTGRYSKDGDVTPLAPHVPVPNLSGESPVQRLFTMDVPAGRASLRFHLSGSLQDMEMRVKRGAAPTLADARCGYGYQREVLDCDITAPAAGTYYVLLTGKYRGTVLTGMDQLSQRVSAIEPLLSGAPLRLKTNVTTIRYFMLYVPTGASTLRVTTRGYPSVSTQGPTLFVRRGEVPMTQTWDCDSSNTGSNESCVIESPQEGLWYVAIDGQHSNDVDLEATHE